MECLADKLRNDTRTSAFLRLSIHSHYNGNTVNFRFIQWQNFPQNDISVPVAYVDVHNDWFRIVMLESYFSPTIYIYIYVCVCLCVCVCVYVCIYVYITWTTVGFSFMEFCGIHLQYLTANAQTTILLNVFESFAFQITNITPRGHWIIVHHNTQYS